MSNSTAEWGPPAVLGTWSDGRNIQKAIFGQPARGRYVKLVALSEVNGKDYASLAEIDLMIER